MKKLRRILRLALVLTLAVAVFAGCRGKKTQDDRREETPDTAVADTTSPPKEVTLDVPTESRLVNKALNVRQGSGTVSVDITMVRNDTQIRAWMDDVPFRKTQDVTFADGTLHVTYGGLNEALTKEDAAESYEMPSYLVRIRASGEEEEEPEEADDESEPEETEKSRYELYVFDVTDDTWERETFAPVIATTARMMAKRMVTGAQMYYTLPDGTKKMPSGTITVLEDDPGEFRLEGSLDVTQLTSFAEDFNFSDIAPDVGGFLQKKMTPEDNVVNPLEGIDPDSLKQLFGENADAAREFLEEHAQEIGQFVSENTDAAKEFLGERGENLQQLWEEHGEEITRFLQDGGEKASDLIGDVVSGGQKAVQGVKDLGYLRQLLDISDRPELIATYDPLTLELKTLTIVLAQNTPTGGSRLYLQSVLITITWDDHEAPALQLPADVKDRAEDKEQGMVFHRMMEEAERIAGNTP